MSLKEARQIVAYAWKRGLRAKIVFYGCGAIAIVCQYPAREILAEMQICCRTDVDMIRAGCLAAV